jgi:ribosomal protection tetracycline resistance protein
VLVPEWPEAFGAKVFKISRDEQGNRLTHLKLTGGSLRVRDTIRHGDWEEKVTAIRLYSGIRHELVNEAEAGSVCVVTGLTQTRPARDWERKKPPRHRYWSLCFPFACCFPMARIHA